MEEPISMDVVDDTDADFLAAEATIINAVSPHITITNRGGTPKVQRVTINDIDGSRYFDVTDGAKGDTGNTGPQGPKGDRGDPGTTLLEYAGLVNFPATGITGMIYCDTTTNTIYRWTGSQYSSFSMTTQQVDAAVAAGLPNNLA